MYAQYDPRHPDYNGPSRQECEREAYEERLWKESRLRLRGDWVLQASEDEPLCWTRTEIRTRKAHREYPNISKGAKYLEVKTFTIEDETSVRFIQTTRRPLRVL